MKPEELRKREQAEKTPIIVGCTAYHHPSKQRVIVLEVTDEFIAGAVTQSECSDGRLLTAPTYDFIRVPEDL